MSASPHPPAICVVGACNIDLISYVPRLPREGETLHGSRFQQGFGGKGANQAVMAAKLGAQVVMLSKLGRDSFGDDTLKNFQALGVDTTHVHQTDEAASGVAPIAVDADGRNSIIIVTGTNDLLTDAEIEAARPAIRASQVLVCQLEIPAERSLKALQVAREEGVRTIFNPAPARESLPDEIYQLSDIFCPNESECELLTGLPVASEAQAETAAKSLLERGPKTVILTLGKRGALVVDASGTQRIEAEAIQAVDSTGAGDSFVGSLAYFLARDVALKTAVARSCQIATRSVLKPGTQSSFPDAAELGDLLNI